MVSGAGVAGLTFATLAARAGSRVLLVERAPSMRTSGYMIDFFGIGWDVADRMGLLSALCAITYPIRDIEFVDDRGRPYARTTLERMREAFDGRYADIMRSDLARVLHGAAVQAGVEVRFGTEILSIDDRDGFADVALSDGTRMLAPLVVGADGVHSGVRRLAFPASSWSGRPLGYIVTAFRTRNRYGIAGESRCSRGPTASPAFTRSTRR